jgi:hypothetical protein
VKDDERENLIHRLASLIYIEKDDENLEELKGKLRGFSDALLVRLADGASDEDSDLYRVEYLISDGETETRVNEALYFLSGLQGAYYSQAINAVQGLRITKSLPSYEDYSTADEDTLRKCVALVGVTVAIMDCSHEIKDRNLLVHKPMGVRYATAIRDENLVRIVMDHAEHYEVIVRAIHERHMASADVIADILDSSMASLAEGVL